jgi:hypothetical protein
MNKNIPAPNKIKTIKNNQFSSYKSSGYMSFIRQLLTFRKIRLFIIIPFILLSFSSFKKYYPKTNTILSKTIFTSGEIFMVITSFIISYLFWPSRHKNATTKYPTLHLSLMEIKMIFLFGAINSIKYMLKYIPMVVEFKSPFKQLGVSNVSYDKPL